MNDKFQKYLNNKYFQVEKNLTLFSQECFNDNFFYQEMLVWSLKGGKRLRPIMLLEIVEASGESIEKAWPMALAVELIHTFSLIHDDLPAIDDDEWRRGQPSFHSKYGEDIAILFGDSLQGVICQLLLSSQWLKGRENLMSIEEKAMLLLKIAEKTGWQGMIGGQIEEILGRQKKIITEKEWLSIVTKKTSALMLLALEAGACLSGWTPLDKEKLAGFGKHLGILFQITDDLIDYDKEKYFLRKWDKEKLHKLAKDHHEKAQVFLQEISSHYDLWFFKNLLEYILIREK